MGYYSRLWLWWLSSSFLAGVAAIIILGPAVASAHPLDGSSGDEFNPWESFNNLSGCHVGEERLGLAKLKKYLQQFGYLPDPAATGGEFSDAFDDALENALLTYQQNFHLNSTGALDNSTLDIMTQPRCGVADIINGTTTMRSAAAHGRNLYSYFPGNPMWPLSRQKLTYAFVSTSAVSLDTSVIRRVFARAFARWSEVTTLTFSEASSAEDADITIGFFKGDHGDGEAFDGVLGTLAHAFSPTDGRFHLDAAEHWVGEGDVTAAASAAAVDLESVAVHEIGHLLGLGHSSVEEAIMYPTIRAGTKKVVLARDDVNGIQSLYGSNPNYNGTAPSGATGTTTTMRDRDASDGVPRSAVGWAGAVGSIVVALGLSLLI